MSQIIFENLKGLYRFKHNGTPVKVYESNDENQFDFNEEVEINYNSDTAPGQGWKGKRFEIREIDIPSCYSESFFIANHIYLKYFRGFLRLAKVEIDDLSIEEFKSIWAIYKKDGLLFYTIVKIWGSKPRTEFRKSLKTQFESWLNTKTEERKYETPFSFNQQRSLKNRYIQREYESLMSVI